MWHKTTSQVIKPANENKRKFQRTYRVNTCIVGIKCGKTWVSRSRLVLKFGNWGVEKMERVLWASNRALWCKTNATRTTFEPPLETTPRTEYTYFALFSSLSRANCRSFWFASLRSSRNSLFSSVGWKTEAMLDNKNPGKMVKVVNKVNQEYNLRKKFRDFFSHFLSFTMKKAVPKINVKTVTHSQ